MIVLIDNYDSFVHNLARYLKRLGQETMVLRNDRVDVPTLRRMSPRAVVLSPGPCTPNEAGCSLNVVRELNGVIPLLGICLGHQAIAAALGGRIARAPAPMHGRTSRIFHNERGIFAGIPSPVTVCRYHSLVVEEPTLPDCLEVIARTEDGVVMAIQHAHSLTVGLQFHPEAILTELGYSFLQNFLCMARLESATAPDRHSEISLRTAPKPGLPKVPVTF